MSNTVILKCFECQRRLEIDSDLNVFFCKYCGRKIVRPDKEKNRIMANMKIKDMEHKEKLKEIEVAKERDILEYHASIEHGKLEYQASIELERLEYQAMQIADEKKAATLLALVKYGIILLYLFGVLILFFINVGGDNKSAEFMIVLVAGIAMTKSMKHIR